MRPTPNTLSLSRARQLLGPNNASVTSLGYGRNASYRRLHAISRSSQSPENQLILLARQHQSPLTTISAIRSASATLPALSSSFARSFSSSSQVWQSQEKPNKQNEAKKPVEAADEATIGKEDAKKTEGSPSEEASGEKKTEDGEAKEGEKKEGEEGEKGEKKDDTAPPPHGDKTPWQVFMETLQTEFKSSKEWNEGTKALSSGYQELQQSPAVQKARAASNKASSTTSAAVKATAETIGKAAEATWESPVGKVIRKGAYVAGSGLEKATRPVRETEAYKSIKNTIDDGSSSRYGGWIEKEERKKRRALREAEIIKKGGRLEVMEEDPEAGTNVTLHKDSAWKESWKEFRSSSKLFSSLDNVKSVYEQSSNPLIETARSWADTVGGFFAENETAMVIKKLREMDPSFQLEPFLIEMREYILPEVLDAYVKGDTKTLKQWLSAAQYNVYAALMQQYTTAGLVSDGRILDIRGVEVANARLLDPGEVPVFVITCRTQEVHVYRNKKTKELAAGVDDKVQQVTYAIGVTRIAEDVNNPETRGWRLIELQKSARDYY